MSEPEYLQTDEWFTTPEGVKKLRVVMNTKEFGPMISKALNQVEDQEINRQLLNTLGEDLIVEYERRLSQRPTVVVGW